MELELAERPPRRREVVWHDIECGRYEADLALWRRLAGFPGESEPVLEIGAGAGRVSLDLARRGHHVTALDRDAVLLSALQERSAGLPVSVVCADARSFELERDDFAVCLVPMQTLQLLGGASGRLAFFARARTHLRSGGLLAFAVVTALDDFDCAVEGVRPVPEIARDGGELYCSEAVRVSNTRGMTQIVRERMIAFGDGRREHSRDVVELDRVSAEVLEREASEAGLLAAARLQVAATEEHAGSLVLSFRA